MEKVRGVLQPGSALCHSPPQVWSNHSALLGALHVCTSTVSSHSLQRTAQHQWNLHSHLVTRVTRVVSYPRPQHITSQPSVPRETLLHTRPAVPSEPGGEETTVGQAVPPHAVLRAPCGPHPRVHHLGASGGAVLSLFLTWRAQMCCYNVRAVSRLLCVCSLCFVAGEPCSSRSLRAALSAWPPLRKP